jgi:DNA polymerase III alpha subunit
MHSSNIIVAMLLAFATTSYASPEPTFHTIEVRKERNGTESRGSRESVRSQCAQIRKLTALTTLASNQTKLDTLVSSGEMSEKKAGQVKAKASVATTKLQALTANSTVAAQCAIINAERKMKQNCRQMKRWEKLTNLASNATALDAFAAQKNMNATKLATLKAMLQKVETRLQEMQANTTLMAFCGQTKQANGRPGNANGKLCCVCLVDRC